MTALSLSLARSFSLSLSANLPLNEKKSLKTDSDSSDVETNTASDTGLDQVEQEFFSFLHSVLWHCPIFFPTIFKESLEIELKILKIELMFCCYVTYLYCSQLPPTSGLYGKPSLWGGPGFHFQCATF